MKNLLCVFIFVGSLMWQPYVFAGTSDIELGVVISEIKMGGITASDEFVEIYNQTDSTLDLTDLKLQYMSANGTTWRTKLEIEVHLGPRSSIYYVSSDYPDEYAEDSFSPGLAQSGGHLRIIDDLEEVEFDRVAWGGGLHPETEAFQAVEANQSIERLVDEDGVFIDTDNNSLDFEILATPTPTNSNLYDLEVNEPEQDEIEESVESQDSTDDSPAVDDDQVDAEANDAPTSEDESENQQDNNTSEPGENPTEVADSYFEAYQPLVINELLPDPVSPQTDARDEFVELFNPNGLSVALSGLTIKAGNSYSYSYTFDQGQVLGPLDYIALTSAETSLTLSNSGGRAKLSLPSGQDWGEAVVYEDAPAGESWSLFEDGYDWTATPSISATNIRSNSGSEPINNGKDSDEPKQLDVNAQQTSAGSKQEEATQTSFDYSTIKPLSITEVFPDPASPQTDADDEFVEIFNPNSFDVPTAGLRVITGSTLNKKAQFSVGFIPAGGFAVALAKDSNISLVNSGGKVQLLANESALDTVSYTKAVSGSSFALFEGKFLWTRKPTPLAKNVLLAPINSSKAVAKKSSSKSAKVSTTYLKRYQPLSITEVFPDPASPQTDADDEFVEIFNPNDEPLNVNGLIIQAGKTFSYKHTLKNQTIPANGYLTISSADSSLTLSNSGGAVRLVLSDESVLGEVVEYQKAKTGQSYALVGEDWLWTAQPTPGAANVAALSAKSQSSGGSEQKGSFASVYQEPEAIASSRPSWLMLGGFIWLTLLYGGYEYRKELARAGKKLRRYKKASSQSGEES